MFLTAVKMEHDENILTALKAKNYDVQFSDLNLMIFANQKSKPQIYFDGMGSLGEKDITEVEANESYGTLAYVDEAHKVDQWTLSNFLKVFSLL